MLRPQLKQMPEKVVLQKTGTHVEVTSGPYTKRQLRELLLSSLSLLSGAGDREAELIRRSGVDPEDIRRIKDGQILGANGKEIFDEEGKKNAAVRLVDLLANERSKTDVENDFLNLLRSKGISDELIDRILKYGLTDEMIRLLKALGLSDEEIAELLGMWKSSLFADEQTDSEESCLSVDGSSSQGEMTVEGFYLMSHFRNPLTKALADMVCKKPWNPAEYLGHWLLNYKIQQEREQKRKEFNAELMAERERRLVKVKTEPNVSEADAEDEEEEELAEDWNFVEYEAD